MCGPIALMLPVDRSNKAKSGLQVGLYHTGRLLAYAMIGLLFGLLGSGLDLFGFQQYVSIIVGVIMIVMVLMPERVRGQLTLVKPIYRMISQVKNALGSALKRKSPDTYLTIGFLNGLLPCGLVYLAVFGAVAMTDLTQGTIYLLAFGAGTIPLMTLTVFAGNFLKGQWQSRLRRWIPVAVVVLGCVFIMRGLGLGIPYLSPMEPVEGVEAQMHCDPNTNETTFNFQYQSNNNTYDTIS